MSGREDAQERVVIIFLFELMINKTVKVPQESEVPLKIVRLVQLPQNSPTVKGEDLECVRDLQQEDGSHV